MRASRGGTRLCMVATTFPLISNDELSGAGGAAAFDRLCAAAAAAGHGALDMSVLHILLLGKAATAAALSAHGLQLIAKCYSSGGGCPTGVAAALAHAEQPHPPQGRSVAAHIAVFAAQVREGDARTFVGTAVYMSPERMLGQSYSFTSDIWSLGPKRKNVAVAHASLPRPWQP